MGENRSNNNEERRQIAETLASEIASGTLRPGQRLVETQLCERFGAKRARIRDVLRELERDGFVEIVPNVGARVTPLTQKEIEQIYDLLSALEGLAVQVITPYVTAAQFERLEHLLNQMDVTDTPAQFLEFNHEFHWLLTDWSENEWLIKFANILRRNQKRFATQSFLSPGQIEASKVDHRKILEAMKQRKPVEAERWMRTHLLRAKTRLIKYMNKSL